MDAAIREKGVPAREAGHDGLVFFVRYDSYLFFGTPEVLSDPSEKLVEAHAALKFDPRPCVARLESHRGHGVGQVSGELPSSQQ
jgi:hypothetical protein